MHKRTETANRTQAFFDRRVKDGPVLKLSAAACGKEAQLLPFLGVVSVVTLVCDVKEAFGVFEKKLKTKA